jgi:hypothetical protein
MVPNTGMTQSSSIPTRWFQNVVWDHLPTLSQPRFVPSTCSPLVGPVRYSLRVLQTFCQQIIPVGRLMTNFFRDSSPLVQFFLVQIHEYLFFIFYDNQ